MKISIPLIAQAMSGEFSTNICDQLIAMLEQVFRGEKRKINLKQGAFSGSPNHFIGFTLIGQQGTGVFNWTFIIDEDGAPLTIKRSFRPDSKSPVDEKTIKVGDVKERGLLRVMVGHVLADVRHTIPKAVSQLDVGSASSILREAIRGRGDTKDAEKALDYLIRTIKGDR